MSEQVMLMSAGDHPERTDFTASRRLIMGLSTVGAANMGLGALRQLDIIHHLPDPPVRGFDSNKVLTSAPAFALGIPDAPVAMSGLLANIPLALAGGKDRDRQMPWLPVAIGAKAVVEVSIAGWYLVQMRTRLHTWCAYCLLGATISTLIAVLSLREASAALRTPRARLAGVVAALAISAAAVATISALDARHRRQRQHQANAA